ncbi:MAG: DUF1015 domain-containing protein [Gemmatimonadetes bacterium]|nr:MAG: DUF1015 domain-containing protein [Gemmatimonadota bacterium]
MAHIRPFKGVRPPKELAAKVASYPYDVINSEEAREIAKGNPYSFLHINKPEIDLDPSISLYDDRVYAKAAENLQKFMAEGILVQDETPHYYLYEQQMGDHKQVGLVVAASVDDYLNDHIKKHELTRKAKEEDRTRHLDVTNCNAGPVFLTYRAHDEIDQLVADWQTHHEPENDFMAEDGIYHRFWVIDDTAVMDRITALFADQISTMYVADGHHRSASAANLGVMRRQQFPNYTGEEPFNFFLAVLFPHNQLKILDYNRVVKDLNGHSADEFLKRIREKFEVEKWGTDPYAPEDKHHFGMFLEGAWYKLVAKAGTFNPEDPIERLDVHILQANVLEPVLAIGDPRTDDRIDFVGGIRGLKELERRVNETGYTVAFSMYPTSIEDLIHVADAGKIMPPKSTWFEPKLRSGLVVHLLK